MTSAMASGSNSYGPHPLTLVSLKNRRMKNITHTPRGVSWWFQTRLLTFFHTQRGGQLTDFSGLWFFSHPHGSVADFRQDCWLISVGYDFFFHTHREGSVADFRQNCRLISAGYDFFHTCLHVMCYDFFSYLPSRNVFLYDNLPA